MHGNDGSLVGVKVDETVTGGLTGELVRHHLDADYPRLSHHVHGILAGKNVKNDRRSSRGTLRLNFNLIDIWYLTFEI